MAFWGLVLFEPHMWLSALGLGPAGKLLTLMTAVVTLALLLRPPSRGWVVPLLSYLLFITLTMPFAVNRGSAYGPIKATLVFYVLAVATLAWVKEPRQARPILLAVFVGQFLWWGLLGVTQGQVDWNSNLSNYDGYGPMMTLGIGLAFYFGLAARNRRLRWLGFAVAALSIAGVVASFARGAVLSSFAVGGIIWLRWPHKLRATAALLAALLVMIVAASFTNEVARGGDLDSPKGFWSDLATVTKEFDESNEGSSNDRRMLWATAVVVFHQYPILGAGAGNFGPAAAELPLEVFAGWDFDNPARLWDRALHSSYYQVLSEGGLVGCLLYLWILIDFFRRNAALRSKQSFERWNSISKGELDIRYLSWGLEAGMVAFLTTGLFYNQLYVHWLYTLIIMNALLFEFTHPRQRSMSATLRQA
jgi:O-antigen ligase